jgi:hypothetical protein
MKTLRDSINEWVEENYPDYEILVADGFDEAFLGVAVQFNTPMAIYDRKKCIEILMRDMSEDEAYEYFEFNVIGAYVGENTPAFIELFPSINTTDN